MRARIVPSLIALALAATLIPIPAVGADASCGLLTSKELEAVVGTKVPELSGGKVPTKSGASVQMCTAHTARVDILLRVAKSTGKGNAGAAAAQGLKMAKDMGAQVDVKTFGPITCSTMIPPKNLEQYGFNTTCSVVKGSEVAAIELTAKAKKDLVSIEKLRPLAETMASRMH